MGLDCLTSKGRSRDPRQGVRWFRRAAAQSHLRAQHWLARCALSGEGCERDPVTARLWCETARAGGFEGGGDLTTGAMIALARQQQATRARAG